MKKTYLTILTGFLAFVTVVHVYCDVALGGDPPDIKVSVVLLSPDQVTTADAFGPIDPIYAMISMKVGGSPVYTTARFDERDFYLDLYFTLTRPDGSKELITADFPNDHDLTLKPPRTETETGVQVEAVRKLPAGWIWTVGPFDVKEWYSLKAGMFSVNARILFASYSEFDLEESAGLTYAPIDSAEWSGEIVSVPVNFKISGEFCADGDKPQTLTLEYTGKECSTSNNSQDQDTCNGNPEGTSPVRIIASSKQDPFHLKNKVWFNGQVNLGPSSTFELDATNCQGKGCRNETRLGGQTFISIFDTNGSLLQQISLHTSCSEPLNFGDEFGGVRLTGFAPEP
jgi:hypothetical protein